MKALLKTSLVLASFAAIISPSHALAKDSCTDAKDMIKVVKNFYAPKPDLSDKIRPEFKLAIKALDGYPSPNGLLYRYGDTQVKLDLDEDGRVMDLEKALEFHEEGEFCKLVAGEVPLDEEGDTTEAHMGFEFVYPDNNGSHQMADIYEGAKDGSKIMKGLAPGGLGFVVPGLKMLMLNPVVENDPTPKIKFFKNDDEITAPKSVFIGKTQLFRLKDIKSSKADRLQISAPYKLEAMFNLKDKDIAKAQAEHEAENKPQNKP